MSYFVIADLDVRKYEIYHIQDDENFYNESFYHDFRSYMAQKTGHSIVGAIQIDSLRNTKIPDVDEDFVYFEPYMQEFSIQRRKESKFHKR